MSHHQEVKITPYSFKEFELSPDQKKRKAEVLSQEVVPFKPEVDLSARDFFERNRKTGHRLSQLSAATVRSLKTNISISTLEFFRREDKEGEKLAGFYKAARVWDQMLDEGRTVYCGAAGTFVPFGGREAFCSLIEHNQIDVLVVTGAQLTHDFVENLGGKHYFLPKEGVSDGELTSLNINRFYKVLGDGEDYKKIDPIVLDLVVHRLPNQRPMTSREYLWRLGWALMPYAQNEGILTTAARKKLPIYVPAFADSPVGTDILEVYHKTGRRVFVDPNGDELEKMEIAAATEDFGRRTSLVIFGGGVVRNNAQQAQASTYAIGRKTRGHFEAIRFWSGDLTDGGLSSSTISEGITWGKFDPQVSSVEIYTDSNFAINAMAQLLLDLRHAKKRKWRPKFLFESDGSLAMEFPNGRKRNLQEQFIKDIGKLPY